MRQGQVHRRLAIDPKWFWRDWQSQPNGNRGAGASESTGI